MKLKIFLLFLFCNGLPFWTQAQNLFIVNPQTNWQYNGTIEEATFAVVPKGAYFEVSMYLSFSARGVSQNFNANDQLEIRYLFDLPEQAIITDSWLWVENDIVSAALMDRWKATQIY